MKLFEEFSVLLDRSPQMLNEFISAMGEKQDLYAHQGNLTDGLPDWLMPHFEGLDAFMNETPNTFPSEWTAHFDAMSETIVALFGEIEKEMPYEAMCAKFEKTADRYPVLYTRGGEMLHRGYFSPEENIPNAKRGTKCRKSTIENELYHYKYWLFNEKPIRAQKFDRENLTSAFISDEFIFDISSKRTLGIIYENRPSKSGFIKVPSHLALCEYDNEGKILRYIFCYGFLHDTCNMQYKEFLRSDDTVTTYMMEMNHGFRNKKNKTYRLLKY